MPCSQNPNLSLPNCQNPCLVTTTNTAECESLPSQIQNFTDEFFGTVIKTEEDGKVVWSLPCNLGTGLPNNPRAEGEGLACYFLRLFNDGIVGLTGPQGDAGNDGAAGRNAYTVLLSGFNQPTLASPNIQIITNYNPAILEGMYVFVGLSGWYLVTNVNVSGALNVTLVKASGGTADGAWVSAGKLVVPSGYPGTTIVGPTGPQGIQGPQGTAGTAFTDVNYQFDESQNGGPWADYVLTGSMSTVDFVGGSAAEVAVQLPSAGTYLITCSVNLIWAAGAPTFVDLELRDETTTTTLDGSKHRVALTTNVNKASVTISTIFVAPGTRYVKLRGKASSAADASVDHTRVCINYIKLDN